MPQWGPPVHRSASAPEASFGQGPASQNDVPVVQSSAPPATFAQVPGDRPQVPETFTAIAPIATPSQVQKQVTPARVLPLAPDLESLQKQVEGCTRCELHKERTHTVFARGSPTSRLVFVGEGPGQEEDLQGKPFVGPAGQLLDKMIEAMGLRPEDIYICNIVKCRPPGNRKPTPTEMQSCAPYLENQLQLLKPEVIVALGGTAVAGLLGITDGITRVRGRFRLYQKQTLVMPTFHPAYLLRNPSAKRQVWSDLKQVAHHLGIELPRS